MKFSIKDFFSECDQIRRKLRICSHLMKKFLMENSIFCVVTLTGDRGITVFWPFKEQNIGQDSNNLITVVS